MRPRDPQYLPIPGRHGVSLNFHGSFNNRKAMARQANDAKPRERTCVQPPIEVHTLCNNEHRMHTNCAAPAFLHAGSCTLPTAAMLSLRIIYVTNGVYIFQRHYCACCITAAAASAVAAPALVFAILAITLALAILTAACAALAAGAAAVGWSLVRGQLGGEQLLHLVRHRPSNHRLVGCAICDQRRARWPVRNQCFSPNRLRGTMSGSRETLRLSRSASSARSRAYSRIS